MHLTVRIYLTSNLKSASHPDLAAGYGVLGD
jgi:hypothetical protein